MTGTAEVATATAEGKAWALRLFHRSVLKQQKLRMITRMLGETEGLRCLDIGSDNGVISYLLRRRGGDWASGDLSPVAVESIRSLVETDVHLLDGGRTPFAEAEFDRIVIVDFLEHIVDDRGFLVELRRILRPDGVLIVNCPHARETLLRRFRLRIGQTDEKHGHLRPGYTPERLAELAAGSFRVETSITYSRFFTECLDTLITAAMAVLRRKEVESEGPSKGVLLTGRDMTRFRKVFRLYAAMYPLFWLMTRLDRLIAFRPGYCLISRLTPLAEKGR